MPTARSPEFTLIAACIAWPRTAERDARTRVLAEAVAWDRALQVARRHGVVGLVAASLRHAGVPVPAAFDRMARRRGRAALRQASEALRLHAALADAGIAVLFLKGTTLAIRAFGDVALRDAVDIDLVVAPADIRAAWVVLAAAGYTMIHPERSLRGAALATFRTVAKDSFHHHPRSGMIVELHWRLSDDMVSPAPPPRATWQWVEIAPGRRLPTLGDAALFVYLCTHGAAHGWARLKWLADIAALVAASDDGGAGYWRAAQAQGAARVAASALLLAHRFLALPLPPGFVAPRSRRLRSLLAIADRVTTAGGGARELAATRYRGWVELCAKLLIAPHRRALGATLRRFAISSEDVGRLALPGALTWLYPLVRVPTLVRRRIRRASARAEARQHGLDRAHHDQHVDPEGEAADVEEVVT